MTPKRLTYKYMMKWLQETFDRLEIEWEPFEMYYTNLRSEAYENGAAPYIIRIRDKENHSNETTVRVEDWLKNMQPYLNTGKYKLHWKMNASYTLSDSSITLIKA